MNFDTRSRRRFLRQLSHLSLAAITPRGWSSLHAQMQMPMPSATPAHPAQTIPPQFIPPMLRSADVTPFVDPLPLPQRAVPVSHRGAHRLRITLREIHASVHRDLPPSRMWSYGPTALAPLIEARSGQPLQVEWVNHLPTRHLFPIDHSLHGCGTDIPDVRANVHLHGGRTPSASDGHPDDWYVPGASRVCTYPLQQEAATLWYHDHAMGLNRLNIYAGLYGMAIIRDRTEDALHLPSGPYEIPLMIVDRMITRDGQLYYPDSGDPDHPWVSEFGGESVLLNGKLFPYLEVEPRLYRIRLLNAANSRFFNLSFAADAAHPHPFHMIGTDQGLLPAPLPMKQLLIAPAERADLLIDFSAAAGRNVHLVSGLANVMQFRVAAAPHARMPHPSTARVPHPSQRSGSPAGGLCPLGCESDGWGTNSLPATLRPIPRTPESAATVTRTITLTELDNQHGDTMIMVLNKTRWHQPVTERPRLGATEIWEFVNLTEDTHPMHLHLVRFQVLDRRVFDDYAWRMKNTRRFLNDPTPPEPHELGWKDVVQCPPTQVTRIIVTFDGYAGRYLYHCHILEHEANDMMRPFEVIA
jgi:spore coat protein A